MNEKKVVKVNKTVIFSAIAIITITTIMVIITTAFALTQCYNKNIAELERLVKLNEAINRLEKANDDLIENLPPSSENSIKSKEPK